MNLKPCPFCGSIAEVHPSSDWDGVLNCEAYFVWCDTCETRGDYFGTKIEAIKAWNTRAERTCHNISTTGAFRCSECDATDLDFWKPDYCHGCGAKVVE